MTDFNIEKIIPQCKEFGVDITEKQKIKLNLYGNLLLEWNEKINLTAITDPNDVLIKHFFDCILFFKNVQVPENATLADVGTGAGFPAMVLKIIRPDLKVTLIDSLNKRLVFLNEVINCLELKGIETVHIRAEEAGKSKKFREKFDIVTARAVAAMPVLAEYCLPLAKVGGRFVAMKGPNVAEEIPENCQCFKILGGEKPEFFTEALTADQQRVFAVCKKISQTPPKYPRKPADISKQPL